MSLTPIYDDVAAELAWSPEQVAPTFDLTTFISQSYIASDRRKMPSSVSSQTSRKVERPTKPKPKL